MRNRLLLVALVLAASGTSAQVDVEVSLTPPVAPFHRQAVFTVVVEAPAEIEVVLPDMRDHFGELPVYGVPDHHTEPVGEDRIRTTESYVLDPIFVKDHVIPPVEVQWGEGNVIAVPSPLFRVRDLTPEELEAAQRFEGFVAGGPGAPGQQSTGWWRWLVALAVLAAAAAALYLFLQRRTGPSVGPQSRMPWELAKERLVALAERQLPQHGKYDTYHVDLSAILRYYIEGRFDLHAPERTTPEFLSEIAGKGLFTPEQEVFLARFLRLCDRVKFAQYRPDLEAMAVSFEEVDRFVDETIPQLEPEEEAMAA